MRIAVLGQGSADNQLEILLAVAPIANVATVEPDDDPAFRNRQIGPVARAGILHERDALFRQFILDPVCGTKRMLSNRGGVDAALDGQHIGHQCGRGGVGHEGCPFRLKIEPLRRDVARDQFPQRRYRRRAVSTQVRWKTITRALQTHIAEQGAERNRVAAFGSQAAAVGLSSLLKPPRDLRLNEMLLGRRQQCLAFRQRQSEIFGAARGLV